MDRFTRNYLIVLGTIALIVLVAVFYESPKIGALNDRLASVPELSEYPYTFRVLHFDNGIATVSSPRAHSFNAFRALRIIFPAMAGEPDDSPRLYEAQEELARLQNLAAETVRADPEVNGIAWELDDRWLRSNGINPDLL
jgi:hypothetical protein